MDRGRRGYRRERGIRRGKDVHRGRGGSPRGGIGAGVKESKFDVLGEDDESDEEVEGMIDQDGRGKRNNIRKV